MVTKPAKFSSLLQDYSSLLTPHSSLISKRLALSVFTEIDISLAGNQGG